MGYTQATISKKSWDPIRNNPPRSSPSQHPRSSSTAAQQQPAMDSDSDQEDSQDEDHYRAQDSDHDFAAIKLGPSSPVRNSSPTRPGTTQKRRQVLTESEDETQDVAPARTTAKGKGRAATPESDSDEVEVTGSTPAQSQASTPGPSEPRTRGSARTNGTDDGASTTRRSTRVLRSAPSIPSPLAGNGKRGGKAVTYGTRGRRSLAPVDVEDEGSDSGVEVSPPKRNTRSSRMTKVSPPKSPTKRKTRAARGREASSTEDSDMQPLKRPRRAQKEPHPDTSSSEDDPPLRRRRRAGTSSTAESSPPRRRRTPNRKSRRADPDEEEAPEALTSEEEGDEIEMDEPERFATESRLRGKKETAFQANLRRLNRRRQGKDEDSTEEEDSDDDSEKDEGAVEAYPDWRYTPDDMDGFIDSDDSSVALAEGLLPEEFSLKRETPEYKFKVVFQYLLALVIRGPRFLPLKGKDRDYLGRQLQDVRDLLRNISNAIAGTLWRPDFRSALERYPEWKDVDLEEMEDYCDGCNRRRQKCWKWATLKGSPYDKETHAEDFAASDAESDDSDASQADKRVLGNLGSLCMQRAKDFHELRHWEHMMYGYISLRYRELCRAKRDEQPVDDAEQVKSEESDNSVEVIAAHRPNRNRVGGRRRGKVFDNPGARGVELPEDVTDVDAVTEWMDVVGVQRDCMDWLGRVENRARNLESHYMN